MKDMFKNKNDKAMIHYKAYTYDKMNSIVSEINNFRYWIDGEIRENKEFKTYDEGYNIALKRVEENLDALAVSIIKIKNEVKCNEV
jgi:hypothetical protein